MQVVVTGAAGVLGSGVVAELAAGRRHKVRAIDLRDLPARLSGLSEIERMRADLADPDSCHTAVEGADVVVHCASIHPWKDYDDSQYWDLNVKATHHLLGACVAAGVRKVVLTSSVEPFAGRNFAPEELPLREDVTPSPRRLYGLTKLVGEEVAARFHRVDGLACVVLRPATFIPREEEHIGPRLLGGTWLYPEDVISAHVLAVDAPLPPTGWDSYFIAPEVPYSPADVAAVRQGGDEAAAVFERHYPGTVGLFARLGLDLPALAVFYDISRARRALAWQPRHGYTHWLDCQRDATASDLRSSYDQERWLS
jgi:UDP-glucose 4-epimerase